MRVLFNGCEFSVKALGELCHHVLRALGQFADPGGGGATVTGESRHHGLRGQDRVVFDHAAVLENATTALKQHGRTDK